MSVDLDTASPFQLLLLSAALGGFILWQLISGKALDQAFRPSVTRKDKPQMYWLVVLGQSAILVIMLVTYVNRT